MNRNHSLWYFSSPLIDTISVEGLKSKLFSRGTKVIKMLTLVPERFTAGFRMVAKVILWCI